MANAVLATYENGTLKPSEKLPLNEHQQVLVVVVPLTPEAAYEPDLARVAKLHEQAETWLRKQPSDAVREPRALSQTTQRSLDSEFDAALAAIRLRSSRFNTEQILADINNAVSQVRTLSKHERARLDAEVEQKIVAIAADATLESARASRRR